MDGGLIFFEPDEQRPLEVPILQGHVDSALALGLPNAFAPRRLDIIANGPTAWTAPFDTAAHVMALNGALGLCMSYGRVPEYWAACDPQAMVAEKFLSTAPLYTTFLIASQCHPSVFDRLRLHEDVRVFHLADGVKLPPHAKPIRHGSSITLTMLWNAPRLGFFDIHVWGWDCCVDPFTGTIHSYDCTGLPIDTPLRVLEFRPTPEAEPTRSFLTTNTWAHEAKQAVFVVNWLRAFGATVTVHGDGLVRHTLDNLLPSPETPT